MNRFRGAILGFATYSLLSMMCSAFVSRDIVPMDIRSELFRLGGEVVCQHFVWQDAFKDHAFVLFPIQVVNPLEVQGLKSLPNSTEFHLTTRSLSLASGGCPLLLILGYRTGRPISSIPIGQRRLSSVLPAGCRRCTGGNPLG